METNLNHLAILYTPKTEELLKIAERQHKANPDIYFYIEPSLRAHINIDIDQQIFAKNAFEIMTKGVQRGASTIWIVSNSFNDFDMSTIGSFNGKYVIDRVVWLMSSQIVAETGAQLIRHYRNLDIFLLNHQRPAWYLKYMANLIFLQATINPYRIYIDF